MAGGRCKAMAATTLVLGLAVGQTAPAQEAGLFGADRDAAFKAAGAVQRGGQWVVCADDPDGGGATIDEVRDLNGDGLVEAVVSEGGTFCNGAAGIGFSLLSKQADGSWRNMLQSSGIPEFLATKGAGGWPDVSVGGPGFCFPVLRWNGREYALQRHEYEGRPCSP